MAELKILTGDFFCASENKYLLRIILTNLTQNSRKFLQLK